MYTKGQIDRSIHLNKFKLHNKKPILALTLGLLVLGASAYLVFSYKQQIAEVNYAEEVAKPLEAALLRRGAMKKCTYGDAGRGSDNQRPWYNSYFEISSNREDTIAAINQIAKDKGYNLSHASVTNRGPVPVDDAYIDNWFYNTVPRQSPYKNLEPGEISLFIVVNNDGPKELTCGNDAHSVRVDSDARTSLISIRVKLPEFKP